MRQAIRTKYLGPTNFRGARVKATCDAGSVTIPWDHAGNVEDNHRHAMAKLVRKLGREPSRWKGGGIGDGYVFVDDDTETTTEVR